jgi:hypothetical protein
VGRERAALVNNYTWGVYGPGEVWIQTEPHLLEATQGRVYLTVEELERLREALRDHVRRCLTAVGEEE